MDEFSKVYTEFFNSVKVHDITKFTSTSASSVEAVKSGGAMMKAQFSKIPDDKKDAALQNAKLKSINDLDDPNVVFKLIIAPMILEQYPDPEKIKWEKVTNAKRSKTPLAVLIGKTADKAFAIYMANPSTWKVVGMSSHKKGDSPKNFSSHNLTNLEGMAEYYPEIKEQLSIDKQLAEMMP